MSELELQDERANLKRLIDRNDTAGLASWAKRCGEELIEQAEDRGFDLDGDVAF